MVNIYHAFCHLITRQMKNIKLNNGETAEIKILDSIKTPGDVKKLSASQLTELAQDIRNALKYKLSIHGGHCGPNFGFVEATIAMHYVFDSPKDQFVFDVSHQTYPHKMLTGRAAAFLEEDKFDDITGYSNHEESEHDFFNLGHTSTSICLAEGLAKGRDLKGDKFNVVAVIGDGSVSGGEALEGLDWAAELGSNLIIVVNDNQMSIAENHGGLYKNLKELRESNGKAECNIFKSFGLDYMYVENGNDIQTMIDTFKKVKDIDHPIVVHVNTQKGKGLKFAEENKEPWHWCMPFDLATGKPTYTGNGESYESLTSEYLLEEMKKDPKVVAITAGTPAVCGFNKSRREKAGKQHIDVGIAEENAVALASGIAKNGGKPVFNVYSTFLQRTYDQLQQDLCINDNPALINVWAASVFGMNDVTHLGIWDIIYLSHIPNLIYLAPTCKEEYMAMLEWGLKQEKHPVAIRVPAGEMVTTGAKYASDYSKTNNSVITSKGKDVAIFGLGNFWTLANDTRDKLKEMGIEATVVNPVYISGYDTKMLESLKQDHKVIITLEDGVVEGGYGAGIAAYYGNSDMKVLTYGLKKEFIDRYNASDILTENRLRADLIAEDAKKAL